MVQTKNFKLLNCNINKEMEKLFLTFLTLLVFLEVASLSGITFHWDMIVSNFKLPLSSVDKFRVPSKLFEGNDEFLHNFALKAPMSNVLLRVFTKSKKSLWINLNLTKKLRYCQVNCNQLIINNKRCCFICAV